MHEATIVAGLLGILERQAVRHGVTAIARVTVKVGRLRAVEPRQLIACFDMFAEEGVAAGAELVVVEVPVRARCRTCGHEFIVPAFRFTCADCTGSDLEVLAGQELYIESFEPATLA
jgi:hydrogenase nickel incorporation protein HypA/HybF